jgi:hypothetical protein
MAGRAPFGFERRVFVSEWTLLVRVAFNACRIRAGSQSGLLQLKTSMRIVAVTALHRSFEHLVMERRIKLRLYLAVTTHAELWLTDSQHVER